MIKKTIEIEGQKIELEASGATPILFRERYGEDLLIKLGAQEKKTEEATKNIKDPAEVEFLATQNMDNELMEKLVFVMAGSPEKNEKEWFKKFNSPTVIFALTVAAMNMWYLNLESTLDNNLVPNKAGGSQEGEK